LEEDSDFKGGARAGNRVLSFPTLGFCEAGGWPKPLDLILDCFDLPWTSFECEDSTGSPRNGDLGL